MDKIMILLMFLVIIGVALFFSGGTFSVVQQTKDYSLNNVCQTYDSCLNKLKEQYTEEQARQMFNCDNQGCYLIVKTVSKNE